MLYPYLFLSIIPILYFIFSSSGPHSVILISTKQDLWTKYFFPLIWYLFTGKVNFAYWYVVFIMVIFIFQPASIKYITFKTYQQIIIFIIFFLISIFIYRPVRNINLIQSVIYFTPIYLLGIIASIYRQQFYKFLQNKELLILLVVIFLAFLQAIYYPDYGSLHKNPFELALPDIMMIQKIFFILFLMSFLHKYDNYSSRMIDLLASSSFGLYFIHPYVIIFLYKFKNIFSNPGFPEIIWVGVISFIVILITLISAKVSKIILGKRSRMIIGW